MTGGRPGLGAQPRVDIATTLDDDGKVIFGSGGAASPLPIHPHAPEAGAHGGPIRSGEAPLPSEPSVHRLHTRTDEIVARVRRR